jgi:1,4-dihydroxy-2-naphthoate polyprenyltransferase
MPVYWFALSQATTLQPLHAVLVFVILHLLVYPSSNGYNSYMDCDTESVGGIARPMQPTRQLFYISIAMDIAAIAAGCFISPWFAAGILLYILASRAYSYRGIRLKKFPIAGYLTVIIFQGGLTYFLVIHGCSTNKTLQVSWPGIFAACLLVGGFYPLTQIYQHRQDKADGVTTLSILLGYTGTFIFTAIVYVLAMVLLSWQMLLTKQLNHLLLVQLYFLPTLVYFFWWFKKVYNEHSAANFVNTMRMNLLASACSNAAFISLFLIEKS